MVNEIQMENAAHGCFSVCNLYSFISHIPMVSRWNGKINERVDKNIIFGLFLA